MMGRFIAISLLLPLSAFGAAPKDPRLAPVQPQIEQIFTAALRDGVPEQILVDKMNEGLAKNVLAPKLAQVLLGYEGRLAEAVNLAQNPAAPPSLLKALVEARTAGAAANDLVPVLLASRDLAAVSRALDVVTDLLQRGFPADRSARTVASVLARNPRQLERIAASALSLASRVSRWEALDAIDRAAGKGLGPDHAAEVLGHSDDRGPDRESSGQRGPGYQHGKGKP
jgi:hypothetical protein